MSIKEQAVKSVFWSAVERFSVQGIQFLLTLVIARILSPDDYGLVAMLGIFMALAQAVIDSGFANALIQKKDRTERDYCTVFYFNVAGSICCYLLLFVASPLIAGFFHEPQLLDVTRVFGLLLIIIPLGIVQQARLTIALDFKRLAQASMWAVIISGAISLWMAYHHYGVWTLVWQSLINNLLRVILLWYYSHWLPRESFSKESFHTLFGFGSKLMLSHLLNTIYTNCYSLIIGRVFSASQLGYFNRSYTLAQFPSSNFTNIVVRAVYPIQCRYQDDMPQLRNMFLKYLRMSCYLIFPVMVAITALAEPLVEVILTPKWLPAVPYLQLLCIAFMWDPVMKINNSMLNVKGRSDYFLQAEIWKKIVAFGLLVASIPLGVTAMCVSLMLYSLADMIIIIHYTNKVIGLGYRQQLQSMLPIVLLNGVLGISLYLINFLELNTYFKLFVGTLTAISIYATLSVLFKFPEWASLLSMLTLRKSRL